MRKVLAVLFVLGLTATPAMAEHYFHGRDNPGIHMGVGLGPFRGGVGLGEGTIHRSHWYGHWPRTAPVCAPYDPTDPYWCYRG